MEKGNIINIIIFVAALVLVSLIGIKYLTNETDTLHFSGPNIYRAVYAWEVMNEQGYEVNLDFEGRWTDTDEKVSGVGKIIEGSDGAFLIEYQDKEVMIGGPTSGKEHIAATSIKLVQTHATVVKIGLEPIETDNFTELVVHQLGFTAVLTASGSWLYNYAVQGTITIDSKDLLKPTVVQNIENALAGTGNSMMFYETGLRLSLSNADESSLAQIMDIIEKNNINVTKVVTSRLTLIVRLKEPPNHGEGEILSFIPPEIKTYSIKVIEKPIQ